MNEETRIALTDTPVDIVTKLSEGNPGALTTMLQLMTVAEKLDPDNFMGSLGPLVALDSYGIYGSRIWMLNKDVCGQNTTNVIALLRACQLGIISETQLNTAIDERGGGLDVVDIVKQVKERLPAFAP